MLTYTTINAKAKARHVNQVHRAKQVIADAAHELLLRQFRDAAEELRQGGVAKLSHVFRPRDWDQRLRGALGPAIGRVMLVGAATELARHKRLKVSKSTATDYLAELGIDLFDDGIATEMPQELIDSIELTLYDSFKRDYWDNVNGTTAHEIENILRRGSTEGLSIRDMARELEDTGEMLSRTRAITIARTESSRALNSGHLDGIKYIEDDTGDQLGKTWISVLGSTTRQTHAEADGQTVATDAPFYVGGYPCMFPGDADLPAQESVNCQCSLTSAGGDVGDSESGGG